MMKVLLIYPEFPDTFWSFKHALKFVRKRAALPPLGLLTVAAMLPARWEKRLVDLNAAALRQKDLEWADLILISAMIAQRTSAVEVLVRCRAAGKTTVAGGPLFTIEHQQFPDVDHLVLNEAEATLPEFLDDFARGCARRVYTSTALPDLRATPAPLWGLAKLPRYASMCVQYSRGCPFNCEFCSVTAMFGHRPRVKTASQVLREIDGLWNAGWRGPVFFVDDNLIGNKRSLRDELLPALIRWRQGRPRFTFYTEASINLADDDALMRLMVAAGFDQVFVGIETPEEASLNECNKRQNQSRDLIADVKRIQHAGMQVQGGFIIGFDNDPPAIFQRQINFIQQSGIVTAMVGLLQAVPGTKLHQRLCQQGRLIGDSSGDNLDGSLNFIPLMDRELLHRGYKQLMVYLYAPGPYYQRIRTFLREYQPARQPRPVRWRNLHAFAAASIRLGILGRERFHYWGLLLWTFLRRPRLLPTAITLAIYGFHFRKCSQAVRV
ncbi:MAG: B12-binding domain-containing radical SAM protein [Oceanipulchritudo sp.]